MKKNLRSMVGDVKVGSVVRLHLAADGQRTNYVGQVSQINQKYVAVGSFKGFKDHIIYFDKRPEIEGIRITGYTKFNATSSSDTIPKRDTPKQTRMREELDKDNDRWMGSLAGPSRKDF